MIQLQNAMQIFKVLPRTNCRDCGIPTCLAFAAAVFKGDRRLADCPHLGSTTRELFQIQSQDSRTLEREEERLLARSKLKIGGISLPNSAERLAADFLDKALTIKMLGKDFRIDTQGNVTSDCHIHGWVTVPLLDYVVSCAGKPVSGNWITLRELKSGAAWGPLFTQRCLKPLRRVAETHTDLFELMIHVFSAKPAPRAFDSDIAVVLHPLPRIPILICYWKPDGEMDSSVNVFFDDSAEDNLTVDSLYRITAGLVIMFEKVAITHGL
ncbi:MAG: DUF3786 domain-containing protein [Pseudomonadota bacterium]